MKLAVVNLLYVFLLSSTQGYEIQTSSCIADQPYINRGESCYYHCSVTGLQDNDYFGVSKAGALYYGVTIHYDDPKTVELYSNLEGLNKGLPSRYGTVEKDNEINITISEVQPEDLGNLKCWVKDESGMLMEESDITTLRILGPNVDENVWGKFNEKGEVEEKYENGQEVDLNLYGNDFSRLFYRVVFQEALAIQPTLKITIHADHWSDDITYFNVTETIMGAGMNDSGLVTNIMSLGIFDKLRLNWVPVMNPTLKGHFSFAENVYESTLKVNLVYSPRLVVCNHFGNWTISQGVKIELNCKLLAHPELTSVTLHLPGRDTPVESGQHEDRYNLTILPQTDVMYYMSLTYHNISKEAIGLNELYIENERGRLAHSFHIIEKDDNTAVSLGVPIRLLIGLLSLCSLLTVY